MNMCHGKRQCTLSADPATFGNPCKPESRMYLKVVYTCGEYVACRGTAGGRFLLEKLVKVKVTV